MSGGKDQIPAPNDKDGGVGVECDHYLGSSAAPEEQGSRGIYFLSSFDRIFASSVRNAVALSKIAPSFESSIHQHRMAGSSPTPPPTVTAPSFLFRGFSAELSNWEQNLIF